jgi:hypothetical protein
MMLAVAEKRLIQYACQDVFIWKKKDESERMGGIEMPAPYRYVPSSTPKPLHEPDVTRDHSRRRRRQWQR